MAHVTDIRSCFRHPDNMSQQKIRDTLSFCCTVLMADDNTPTVGLVEIKSAVAVALKKIPDFEAIMAEEVKRATERDEVGRKDDNDGDNREGDNNLTNTGE